MSDDLRSKFETAKENEILLGQQSESIDGVIKRGAAASSDKENAFGSKSKHKKRDDDIWRAIDAMQAELDAIDQRMAENYERLKYKYGDDVIGGMASTYLDEDINKKLTSDEERLQALSDLFLDEYGNVKDKYKDLPEAQFVSDWKRSQILRPVVEKYCGRDTLTPDEQQEVLETAQKAGLAENTYSTLLSDNKAYQAAVDNQLESDVAQSESKTNSTDFNFT